MESAVSRHDVVIIGGGLVGCSAALMLRQTLPPEASILVVESAGHEVDAGGALEFAPDFDVRTTALSHGSRQIYGQLGLWPRLAPRATPIHTIHVSERDRPGSVRLDRHDVGVEALGQVVENRCLGTALLQAVRADRSIDWLSPAVTEQLTPLADGMRLSVRVNDATGADGALQQREAGLVVLADGGRSKLCQQLGIARRQTDYGQQAIVANVGFRQSHEHRAFERFTESGPLALLPLSPWKGLHRAALIWTQPDEQARALLDLPEPEFLSALQQHFGYRLGAFEHCGRRHCFPLQLTLAREQVRPGLVLLGNVAHTLHPVAGQGLNLALRDASRLAYHLGQAMAEGCSPGDRRILEAYSRQQQPDQDRTIAFSHHLVGLFSGAGVLKRWTRRFGLFSIDLMPPVRQPFVRAAMGLGPR
ncbi:MAG: 2-octaprenyl-6-methoxyphenyl hydroxylase [Pseudomonadota bacterium]